MIGSGLHEVDALVAPDADLLWHHLAGNPVVLLDFDGTLAPIADDPDDVFLSEARLQQLRILADTFPTAIVTGRALDDIRVRVDLPALRFAANHGIELWGQGLDPSAVPIGPGAQRATELVGAKLAAQLGNIAGIRLERKPFSVAVHTRNAESDQLRAAVKDVVTWVANQFPEMKLVPGRELLELRPDVPWDKGSAVDLILDSLEDKRLPLYIGDDVTDEDGFRQSEVRGGVGVVVRSAETSDRKVTSASYALDDVDQVWAMLGALVELAR